MILLLFAWIQSKFHNRNFPKLLSTVLIMQDFFYSANSFSTHI